MPTYVVRTSVSFMTSATTVVAKLVAKWPRNADGRFSRVADKERCHAASRRTTNIIQDHLSDKSASTPLL